MKINKKKLDLIKLKIFFMAKEIMNKIKKRPSIWDKRISKEVTNKGLISKIHKQFIKLNIRKTKTQPKTEKKT